MRELCGPANRFLRVSLCAVAWCGLITGGPAATFSAQTPMAGHVMEMQDEIPPDELPPPQKLTGVGSLHLPITATPEAQTWFDQGLNLLHDYWDYESARAFEQSVRVDPQCAMCYWGLYEAESFFHGTSRGYAARALARARDLQDRASAHERLYIQASSAAYREAASVWRAIVKQYPEDSLARIYLALSVEDGFDDRGEPRAGQQEALAILRDVLTSDPESSAANHYYIHALEAGAHPEQALHSAEILATLAPASGHMVHMPGHIFFRMGDYARAEQAFDASRAVDERYMREQHVDADHDWNYVHNLMYAIANLMEEGKLHEATALSAKLSDARGVLDSTLYVYSVRDSISRIDPELPVALRTANWAEVAALLDRSRAPANRPNLMFLAQQLANVASGMAAIDAHDLANAADASSRLDAALVEASDRLKPAASPAAPAGGARTGPPQMEILPDALLAPIVSSLSIMSRELRASLLTAKGQTAEAKALFDEAARVEKTLGYREPPAYLRPVRETEGAALLAARDWSGAGRAFEQALAERPRSGWSLYGLAMSREQAGEDNAAVTAYADFLAAWTHADAALPQLAHARAYLAAHRQEALLGLDSERIDVRREHVLELERRVAPGAPAPAP